jgi:hypothetical protein
MNSVKMVLRLQGLFPLNDVKAFQVGILQV